MRLDELVDGQAVLFDRYDAALPAERRRRFEDLGLLPGTLVSRERRAPLGDPLAFMVRGNVLCLRREEAALMHVKAAV